MHDEHRPWSETVKSTATKLAFAPVEDVHRWLTEEKWTPEEAHFIIQAAEFVVAQELAKAAE